MINTIVDKIIYVTNHRYVRRFFEYVGRVTILILLLVISHLILNMIGASEFTRKTVTTILSVFMSMWLIWFRTFKGFTPK